MFSKKQTIKTNIFPNQKTFHLNNVQIKPTHEIIGKFPTTVLSPEDIDVVSGGNAIKLRFIDKILSTTDKQYFFSLKEFKRVLKQRNKTLSQGNRELVSIWDDKLAKTTQKIWKKRDQFFQEFSQIFNRSWKNAPQHHIGEVFYSRKQLNKKDVFLQELQNNIERDLILKTTTTGAHKDKVEFKLDKKNIKEFGSQGEKKLFLSNLKFSEAEYISKTTHTEPVLLLDDLFEKLDIEKINYILNKTKKFTQSIITTTDNSIESVVSHINGLNKIQLQHV
jgi:DNA replication and repair protein RecF